MTRLCALLLLVGCADVEPASTPFAPRPVSAPPVVVAPPAALPTRQVCSTRQRATTTTRSMPLPSSPAPSPPRWASTRATCPPRRCPARRRLRSAGATCATAPGGRAGAGRVDAELRGASAVHRARGQPPRAVLAFGDGSEHVVQPGAMLADQRVIVLAIGVDQVELARVEPRGDSAAVEPLTLRAMYPRQ